MIEVSVRKKFHNNQSFQYNLKTDSNRVVLFGPSGSGKSNLIKMIVGFYDPDEGTIKVNNNTYFDKNGKKLPIYKRRVGYLPQEYTLFPHMNVEENILYGIKINKIKIDKEQFNNLLNKLELIDKLSMYPHELSGGEKQRVAFARAILINPDILLFDEPFSALDKAIKEKLREEVIDIIDETGKKAIFVTHDFEDAFILGKEVYIIYNGKIIESGPADKIFNKPKFVETAKIINIKNLWNKEAFENCFSIFNIKSEFVAIKQENIIIWPEFSQLKFKALIERVKNKGLISEIELRINHLKLFSNQPFWKLKEKNLKEGDKVEIGFNKDDVIFLKEFEAK